MDGDIDATFWHNATYSNHVHEFGDFSFFQNFQFQTTKNCFILHFSV
jgi:hypothetical protein